MALDSRRVAILGAGTIGESLIAGLLSAGWRAPEEIVATGRREERLAELAERFGVRTTLSNREAVAGAALVVIAVKPQDFEELLRDEHIHPVQLREAVTSPGGTTIRAIRELERAGVRAAFLNAIQAAMERSRELAAGAP